MALESEWRKVSVRCTEGRLRRGGRLCRIRLNDSIRLQFYSEQGMGYAALCLCLPSASNGNISRNVKLL